jgi:hypothetical protein
MARQARRRPKPWQVSRRHAPHRAGARMRGQYPTKRASRPRPIRPAGDEPSARLFLCGRCREMVIICRRCDRGQIYCNRGCAQDARRCAQRDASRRYQSSRRGRLNHAARNRRYRARKKNGTHQGSLRKPDLSPLRSTVRASESPWPSRTYVPAGALSHCHWCGSRCSQFVRQRFVRIRRVIRSVK